ncbi:HAD hydrolase-like protein [Bosea sp. RAF48]|uniref:HAD hydrolase-like protein n=1 Tax=Bosea sp. RAF48 TaxID=3237480 RepID=UPI003F90A641
MPPFSLAIFDYDGTLADSFPWFCSVLNQTARRFGFREVAEHEIEELRGLGSREIVARLQVPLWRMPSIAVHMRKLSADSRDEVRLFPGVENMLASLAASNIQVAIVSSNGEEAIREKLGSAAVHVSHFNCGASLWGKAAKFQAVIKRSGASKQGSIAVGDEVRDIEAARSVGIAAGAVTFGYNAASALRAAKPDMTFDSIGELSARLTHA